MQSLLGKPVSLPAGKWLSRCCVHRPRASRGFLTADVLGFLCAEPFDVKGLRVKDFSAWPQLDTLSVNGFVPTGAGDTPFPSNWMLPPFLVRVPSVT